jgi:6-phosphogluconolactonase
LKIAPPIMWRPLDSAHAVAWEACSRILRAAQEAIVERDRFSIVLAGGSTPEQTYRLLSDSKSDWSNWHVYFGDERCLTVTDLQRNSLMAARALTDTVPIPQNQIHPIPAELGPEQAAQRYAEEISDALPFDLVLLGLGEDGHTASLFPGQEHPIGPAVLAIHQAPKAPAERVSLSPNTLACCRQLMFLVTGSGKRIAVQSWKRGEDIPAAGIRGQGTTEVLIDRSAWGNHRTEDRG